MQDRSMILIVSSAAIVLALFSGVALGKGMAFKRLNPQGTASDLPFSHAVVAGDTIYIAGTLGVDPETGKPPEDAKAEARLVLDGIQKKLELAGADMDDLVSVQVFCPDLALYEDFNAVYRTYFRDGYPARAFIGSGPLLRGTRFEIQAIAVKR